MKLRMIYYRERWHIKRDLYDWWLRKIKEGASVGHRYSCLCVLASYAVKCDIPEDELFTDAFSLLQFYQENYVTYSRSEAERVSAIPMPASAPGRKESRLHTGDRIEQAHSLQVVEVGHT